jgi:hypothetical protein
VISLNLHLAALKNVFRPWHTNCIHARKDVMLTAERYLHFDNIDMSAGQIVSCCSLCGMEFSDVPRPGEHVDELLLRIRASFDAHDCGGVKRNA